MRRDLYLGLHRRRVGGGGGIPVTPPPTVSEALIFDSWDHASMTRGSYASNDADGYSPSVAITSIAPGSGSAITPSGDVWLMRPDNEPFSSAFEGDAYIQFEPGAYLPVPADALNGVVFATASAETPQSLCIGMVQMGENGRAGDGTLFDRNGWRLTVSSDFDTLTFTIPAATTDGEIVFPNAGWPIDTASERHVWFTLRVVDPATGDVRLFVNNQELAATSTTAPVGAITSDSGQVLNLGGRSGSNGLRWGCASLHAWAGGDLTGAISVARWTQRVDFADGESVAYSQVRPFARQQGLRYALSGTGSGGGGLDIVFGSLADNLGVLDDMFLIPNQEGVVDLGTGDQTDAPKKNITRPNHVVMSAARPGKFLGIATMEIVFTVSTNKTASRAADSTAAGHSIIDGIPHLGDFTYFAESQNEGSGWVVLGEQYKGLSAVTPDVAYSVENINFHFCSTTRSSDVSISSYYYNKDISVYGYWLSSPLRNTNHTESPFHQYGSLIGNTSQFAAFVGGIMAGFYQRTPTGYGGQGNNDVTVNLDIYVQGQLVRAPNSDDYNYIGSNVGNAANSPGATTGSTRYGADLVRLESNGRLDKDGGRLDYASLTQVQILKATFSGSTGDIATPANDDNVTSSSGGTAKWKRYGSVYEGDANTIYIYDVEGTFLNGDVVTVYSGASVSGTVTLSEDLNELFPDNNSVSVHNFSGSSNTGVVAEETGSNDLRMQKARGGKFMPCSADWYAVLEAWLRENQPEYQYTDLQAYRNSADEGPVFDKFNSDPAGPAASIAVRINNTLSSNAFSTIAADETVTVTEAGHDLIIGATVNLSSVGELDGLNMNGNWIVTDIPDADTWVFEHTGTASSGGNYGAGGTSSHGLYSAVATLDADLVSDATEYSGKALVAADDQFAAATLTITDLRRQIGPDVASLIETLNGTRATPAQCLSIYRAIAYRTRDAAAVPYLGNLTLDQTEFEPGVPSSFNIVGAEDGSTIVASNLPAGITIDGAARTGAWDGSGTINPTNITLTETLAGSPNSGHQSVIAIAPLTALHDGLHLLVRSNTLGTAVEEIEEGATCATGGSVTFTSDVFAPAGYTMNSSGAGAGHTFRVNITPSAQVSYGCWVIPSNVTTQGGVISEGVSTQVNAAPILSVYLAATSRWRLAYDGDGNVIDAGTGNAAQIGVAQHLCVTIGDDPVNGGQYRARLYVDGVEAGEVDNLDERELNATHLINAYNTGTDAQLSNPVRGEHQGWRVWERELTAAEVAQVYAFGRFEGVITNNIRPNSSGTGLEDLVGGATLNAGGSLTFDADAGAPTGYTIGATGGDANYLFRGDGITTSGECTIMAWVIPNASTDTGGVFSEAHTSQVNAAPILGLYHVFTGGSFRRWRVAFNGDGNLATTPTEIAPANGVPTHLAVRVEDDPVNSGKVVVTLFVDGTEAASASNVTQRDLTATRLVNAYEANTDAPNSSPLKGAHQGIRYYSRALSDAEVAAIYALGRDEV